MSLDAMLAQLERRLRDGGGTAADWQLLAQTYDYLGRNSDPSDARHGHIVPAAGGREGGDERWPLILASLGAHSASGMGAAAAEPATVDITPVMDQSPASSQTRQLAQQSLDQAHQAIRSGGDCAHAKTFAQNLAEDQRLANAESGQNSAIFDAPSTPASGSLVQVSGEVTVAESLKRKIPSGRTLFIVAKSTNSPGAPVAVVRTQTDQWPLKFTLDDSLAMMPERKLSTAGSVMIEVRVSQGGTAASQSGDLQSAPAIVDPHSGKSVHLVIDHVIS